MAKIVRKSLHVLMQADDGVAAIEYGLLAALIAGVLLIGLSALGSSLNEKFSQVASAAAASQSASSSGGGNGNNGNGKGGNGNGNNGNGNGNGGPNGGSGA